MSLQLMVPFLSEQFSVQRWKNKTGPKITHRMTFCTFYCSLEQKQTSASRQAGFVLPKSSHSSRNLCFTLCFWTPHPPIHIHTAHPDNTAGIRTQRSGFNRHEQNVYFLPILVVDSGPPSLSSTGTLTIHVCGCDTGESYCRSCTITNIIITVTFCISSSATIKVIHAIVLVNKQFSSARMWTLKVTGK